MSTEENKATMRRVFKDALSEGNLDIIPELIAPEYRYRSPLGLEARDTMASDRDSPKKDCII